MRFLSLLLLPIVLPLMLLRWALRVTCVPLHHGLVRVANQLGPLRLVLLGLTLPIHLVALAFGPGEGYGRVLEGDIIRPTFSLPYAFARGPWQVAEEQTVRCARLNHEGAVLDIRIAAGLTAMKRSDSLLARAVEKTEGGLLLDNGMRWVGVRMSVLTGVMSCLYLVWKDADPEAGCVFITFTGSPEVEPAADAFVQSAMPVLTAAPEPQPSAHA